MSRLLINDDVRAFLSTDAIERLIAQRETTELTCVVCGQVIPPEAPDTVNVILRFDTAGGGVLQYAHAACAPSHLDRAHPVVGPAEERITYLPILLRRRHVTAALIWEPRRMRFDVERSQDLNVSFYRELGFAPCETGLASIFGPMPAGLVLDGDASKLLLRSRQEPIQEFDDIEDLAPPGWLDAARAQRRCLLVMGEMIGLDRLSDARLNTLLADGRVVAAVALAKISR